MASPPPHKPDRIDPQSPPETPPLPDDPYDPSPEETEPLQPDFDQPGESPEELPDLN